MSTAWSWFVIALVVLQLVGCAWLLWWTARRKPGDPAPTDTSHVWDSDITEYNKPLPKWWINLFWLTIAFSIAYLAWFGGFGGYMGFADWTSKDEYALERSRQNAALAETFALYDGKPIDQLARNPHALAIGRSVFNNTCAACHGSSAQGATGYPRLDDGIWHWGGTPEQILTTVLDGREGVMPPWGKVLEGIGGPQAVDNVTAYVQVIDEPDALRRDYFAARGKPLYEAVCVACHGADGKGNPTLGAPDLTDDYWMYGGTRAAIRASIADGRHGVMPAHRAMLGETRARLVAAYVWSLSNQPEAAARARATAAR